MAAQQELFDPQAGFLVTASNDFANFNADTFTRFYQPVLGPTAYSLFYALKDQLIPHPTLGDRRMQVVLISQLNTGINQITKALHRLEAVGMVKSFKSTDMQGDLFIYQLHPTLTPAAFFEDDLLSVLLLENIGEMAFEQLSKTARQYELASHPDMVEISTSFLDEFHISDSDVINPPKAIQNARRQHVIDTVKPEPKSDFDWPTLFQLLNNQPIIKADLERHKQLVEVEHQLYGIDEPTMKGLILKAVNLSDNHFDAAKFKRIVAQTYQQPEVSQPQEKPQTAPVDNSNLTKKDQQLIKSVSGYAPIDFLQSLKEQTGGFVTSSERAILTHLISDVKLDSSVINVLTWYVLAALNNDTLNKNFVDAIANNWVKAGVHDGTSAVLQLKKFNEKKASEPAPSRNKKWKNNYRGGKIDEKMPEWTKTSQEERNRKASQEEVQAVKELLAKRKKQ
ncbi:MAG: DnaD domain protein [Limosilactobacillus sp.]|uniref:replication initiation and membrane attachment family protein n=1 Tax=Limosilactobacillus sp. TaxID=2773925 RepID=UPI0026FF870D|nr:DnaD domain protein [Limosilactobacillus sp.]